MTAKVEGQYGEPVRDQAGRQRTPGVEVAAEIVYQYREVPAPGMNSPRRTTPSGVPISTASSVIL